MSNRILIALSGILGTAALVVYYSAPYTFMPLPAPDVSAAQVMAFGARYSTTVLVDAWLQVAGATLSVIFALGLVHLAHASDRPAGKLTLLVSGVIMALALAEATFEIAAASAAAMGHTATGLVSFDLTNTFIHVFLIAPSLFLVLGIALLGTPVLPRGFSYAAIGLGIVVQALGFAGLFTTAALLPVIIVLMLQIFWNIAAAITLAVRPGESSRLSGQSVNAA
jgi:hypothetical protein